MKNYAQIFIIGIYLISVSSCNSVQKPQQSYQAYEDTVLSLVFAYSWDGSASDIFIDKQDNVYIVGNFSEPTDFDPGDNYIRKEPVWISYASFLSKFNSNGDLVWNLTWGGFGANSADHVWVDDDGCVYVMGKFTGSVDLDPGPENLVKTGRDLFGNIYLSKFNPNGGLIWVVDFDNPFSVSFNDFIMDKGGRIYAAGSYGGRYDFDPGPGIQNRTAHDHKDAFLLVLDHEGNFDWVQTWGTAEREEEIRGLASGRDGTIYATGQIFSNVAERIGFIDQEVNLQTYAFLTSLDSDGNTLWTRTWGGLDIANLGSDVIVDKEDRIYVFGRFVRKVDFNPDFLIDNRTISENVAYFISRFNPDGKYTGAVTLARKTGRAQTPPVIDNDGNVYFGGNYVGPVDFDIGPGEEIREVTPVPGAERSFDDIYVTKYNSDGEFQWVVTWGNSLIEKYAWKLDVDSRGDIYIIGGFFGEMDFDPSSNVAMLSSQGIQIDTFFLKLSQQKK